MYGYGSTVLVLLVAAGCSGLTSGAGSKLDELFRQKRVIGGQAYTKGEYPFHVSLWFMGNRNPYPLNLPNRHVCGGVLIHRNWVLTSAVCFENMALPGSEDGSNWNVYLGVYKQSEADNEAQMRHIVKIIKTPLYMFFTYERSVALVKLDSPATLSASVALADLNNDASCPIDNQQVEIIGWGQTQRVTQGLFSDAPHKATVGIYNLKDCRKKYHSVRRVFGTTRLDNKNLCAGVSSGDKDTSWGDLGSPLLATCGGNKNVVVGTTAFGYTYERPTKDFPSFYNRISSYYDWIMQTMRNNA